MEFKPERITRSSTLVLNAPIEKVFPLFGPVLEKEWAEGWEPEIIYPSSGRVEERMIFRTEAHNVSEGSYTWVITQYKPDRHLIEYMVSTSQRVWFIQVICKARDSKTGATVTYAYTGLTGQGNDFNTAAIEKMFFHDLKDWEEAINYYLETGKKLLTSK